MIVELIIVCAIFVGLALIKVPIGVALGVGGIVGITLLGLGPVNAIVVMYRSLDVFVLLAIPFFLAVGFLAYKTSIGDRLVHVSAVMTGGARGGLGHVNVVVSMLFAGLSGSATADVTGEGSWMIPAMQRRGYGAAYAAALTAITSVIGVIIPPSLMMIIYSAYAGVSVGALFAAGFVPGILFGITHIIINHNYAVRHDIDKGFEFDMSMIHSGDEAPSTPIATRNFTKTQVVLRAIPALLVPAILLGGTTLGVFTATEAGAVALLFILFLTVFVYRELSVQRFGAVLTESFKFYALPLFAAAAAGLFGFVITYMRAPDMVRDVVGASDLSATGFLLLVTGVFLVLGAFLDAFPAIILFAPIFIPTAEAIGIHPLVLGLVVVLTLALGLVTPPYGICLFIAAKLADRPTREVARALVPFYIAASAIILILILWPAPFLALPRALYPELF